MGAIVPRTLKPKQLNLWEAMCIPQGSIGCSGFNKNKAP